MGPGVRVGQPGQHPQGAAERREVTTPAAVQARGERVAERLLLRQGERGGVDLGDQGVPVPLVRHHQVLAGWFTGAAQGDVERRPHRRVRVRPVPQQRQPRRPQRVADRPRQPQERLEQPAQSRGVAGVLGHPQHQWHGIAVHLVQLGQVTGVHLAAGREQPPVPAPRAVTVLAVEQVEQVRGDRALAAVHPAQHGHGQRVRRRDQGRQCRAPLWMLDQPAHDRGDARRHQRGVAERPQRPHVPGVGASGIGHPGHVQQVVGGPERAGCPRPHHLLDQFVHCG